MTWGLEWRLRELCEAAESIETECDRLRLDFRAIAETARTTPYTLRQVFEREKGKPMSKKEA